MTPKNPTSSIPYISGGKYADYVAALGPAPTGFRYLKVGEKFNNATDYCLSFGKCWEKYEFHVSVDDNRYPCITPSPAKRDSKGRFASQKVADEKLKAVVGVVLADLKKVIDGDKEGLYNAFSWASTEQGNSYWFARRNGNAAITASDLDYLKRLYVLKGGKLEPEAPKVKPAFDKDKLKNVRIDKRRDTEAEGLTFAIAAIDRVLGGDRLGLSDAFAWGSTEFAYPYWINRKDGDVKISAADMDFIRAVRAEFQSRLDALPKPQPPKPVEVPLAERVKKVTSIEIPAIDLVLAGKVDQLSLAFYWASTEQGRQYWEDRRWARSPLSAADLEYLKALRAEKERQLGRKVGPHDTRLQALTRAYEALGKEIAALKAELG